MRIRNLFVFAPFFFTSISGFAQSVDRCEDYLDRHYKSDLIPVDLRYEVTGGVRVTYVRVRNIGTEPFNFYNPFGPYKTMSIAIGKISSTFYAQEDIPAGAEVELFAWDISPRVKSSYPYVVSIDHDQEFGQHGCGVLGNDEASLKARMGL